MSLLTIPWTPSNGTGPANIIDAVQYNAVNTAIATAVNNIWPSQVLPTTTGQATFGATATGVGYKFLANDATATPLTISGVTSQSADIFDVTLTSGGTKALIVNAQGVLSTATSATTGELIIGGATTHVAMDSNITTTNAVTFTFTNYTNPTVVFQAARITAASDGATQSYVPPMYSQTGTIKNNTAHLVDDSIAAVGGSTTFTVTNAAVFSNSVLWLVFDTGTLAFATITAQAFNSVTFASTNAHTYRIIGIGD